MSSMFHMGPAMLGPASLAGDGSRRFHSHDGSRSVPPSEYCNAAWDPGCPRPLPTRTMVPYVPSSYMDGPLLYSVGTRLRPRDRSGRVG